MANVALKMSAENEFYPQYILYVLYRYLDFRSGGVEEGHIVKLNISFDPVKLISSLR